MLVWAVVGLALWIPMLFRTTVFITIAVAVSAISGGSPAASSRVALDLAIGFYARGFASVVAAFDGDPSTLPSSPWGDNGPSRIAIEVFTTLAFWSFLVFYYANHISAATTLAQPPAAIPQERITFDPPMNCRAVVPQFASDDELNIEVLSIRSNESAEAVILSSNICNVGKTQIDLDSLHAWLSTTEPVLSAEWEISDFAHLSPGQCQHVDLPSKDIGSQQVAGILGSMTHDYHFSETRYRSRCNVVWRRSMLNLK